MTDALPISSTAQALDLAARADAFEPTRRRLAALGLDDQSLRAVLMRVSHGKRGQAEVLRLVARVRDAEPVATPGTVERYVLLRVARTSVEQVSTLPVPDGVKQLLLDEFLWLTSPRGAAPGWLEAGGYVFSALCKLVTFRRFPAGQLHWEVAGLERSALLRIRWRDLPRLVRALVDFGGFRPAFTPHLAWRRRQIVLSEREHYRSLALMAGALELQPEILGIVGEAWFYSPETATVSPHLAWAARLFEPWGGTVVVSGRADENSGFFQGSRRRRELAEAGTFVPTLGLAIWPRSGIRHWAANGGPDVGSRSGEPNASAAIRPTTNGGRVGIKSTALRTVTGSGAASLFRPLTRNAAVVFMLHRFADPERGVRGYSPATVRGLLAYLRREKYRLVGLETLFGSLAGHAPPVPHAVAFTIDDGYLEQATIAGPLFAEFDCPVTTFVTTGFVDGRLWLWWDQVHYTFARCGLPRLSVELDDELVRYDLGDAAGREGGAADFTERCKALPDHRKREAIVRLAAVAGVSLPDQAPPAYAPMTWDQLRACERRGMSFAPHTVTHPVLSRTGDVQARTEIIESWTRLCAEAERPSPIFAYPNGQASDFGPREFNVMRDAGLRGAVTAVTGFATSRRYRAQNGEFMVPRVPFPDSLPYLIQQVGGLERLKSMLRRAQ